MPKIVIIALSIFSLSFLGGYIIIGSSKSQTTMSVVAQAAPAISQFPATNSEKGCVLLDNTVDVARYAPDQARYAPDRQGASATSCRMWKTRWKDHPEHCLIVNAGMYSFVRTKSLAPIDAWTRAKLAKGCAMMMFDISEEQFWNTELGRITRHNLGNGNVVP
jgi:hypothetical protein